ncbi:AbrB family transcriptional regulator [Labrenzia sp. CE80]|uniref:AbrB family transcriptional regulator n=1 Tax=Labrenzia sp. CE80 TaxID=1788986 RepID=UPI00129AC46F|nr:AbrB family transcriptional regulator [Labrenzia sp. CE80]
MVSLRDETPTDRRYLLRAADWAGLLVLAAMLWFSLSLLQFPASALLGTMIAGIVFGIKGSGMSMPRPLYRLAQGFAGVFIARSMTPEVLVDAMAYWPLLILVTALTLFVSFAAGWGINRLGKVPAQPAILGSLPGMSGAMVVIALERGIDGRIVALMQYARLASVILAVSLISHFGAGEATVEALSPERWPESTVFPLLISAGIACLGIPLGRFSFIPAASMLVPLIIGSLLEASGSFHIVLLDEAINLTFAIIGLEIGLKFTKASLVKVIGYLPVILVSCVALNLAGLVLGGLLMLFLPVDPLTAFLATAPGSIETVALVAVASHAQVPVVLTFQTVRLFVVVLLGPYITEQLSKLPIWHRVSEEEL